MTRGQEITRLLHAASSGVEGALDEVVDLLYEDLLTIAHRQLRREATGHTLDTAAVVHEAYFQFQKLDGMEWKDRSHFFGMAGAIMRRVLVRYARDRNALKRGGGARPVSLSSVSLFTEPQAQTLLETEELLDGLDEIGPRCRVVVESRVFAGRTLDEVATQLDVSVATVKRDWVLARAWLNHQLSRG